MLAEVARLAPSHSSGSAASLPEFALGVSRSFSGRAWRLRPSDEEKEKTLVLSGVEPALARVLSCRGVPPEDVEVFLNPRLKSLLPEPYRLAQMERAAIRFTEAVRARETIAILADYDVDGACAAALLLTFLRRLGREPLLHVPDRVTEGYGPSPAAVEALRAKGASLLVTVDCGAGASAACQAARATDLDVIVLDHHAVERHPPVFAHVNPNAPGDESGAGQVCAAGLTFLFLVAVNRLLREAPWFRAEGMPVPDLLAELDIVALATIADVVPLLGVNRAFVRQGLRRLNALERPGLAALARVASSPPPYSAYHLGFVFGPRINAGGRVGRSDLGARLLVATTGSEAEALAAELDRHNRERQAIEAAILQSADALAAAQREKPFLLVAGEGWHPGVVGIVAGRLKERHFKPVLVAGFAEASPSAVARGSARSVKGVDLGAIIREAVAAGHLEAGGGHPMAAGFAIRRDRWAAFGDFLAARLTPRRNAILAASDLLADAIVSASAASRGLVAALEKAGPYGAGHPEPVVLMPDMRVAYADIVGGSHVRLRLAAGTGESLSAVAFRAAGTSFGRALIAGRGRRVHAAGKFKCDDYGGVGRLELVLEDAAAAAA